MKLEEYLKIQKDFLKFLGKSDEIEQYFLGAINSLSSASDILLPKSYKIQDKNISDYYKYSKFVDAFKFLLCIFNYYNLDINKFDKYFDIITRYVYNRYKLKEILINQDKYNKIALIDIDGVLADFPNYFIQKFNIKYKTNYHEYNDIPLEKRNIYKEYYRISGEKANIPLCDNAKNLIDELKRQHYIVILFTNRPIHLYKNIAYDTTEWITKNNLYCDTILFAEDKMLDVIKRFKIDNIKLYIEDNIENANHINNLGIKTYLKINELNIKQLYNVNKNIKMITNLNEVIEEIK